MANETLTAETAETGDPGEKPSDIDQILADIDEIQKEMDTGDAASTEAVAEVEGVESGEEVEASESEPVDGTEMIEAIEALEGEQPEASEESEAIAQGDDDALKEFRASTVSDDSADASLSDLDGLKDETEAGGPTIFDALKTEDAEPVGEAEADLEQVEEDTAMDHESYMEESESKQISGEGALTLRLQGNMTLKLQYEFEGNEVTVSFEEGCLKLNLADGTEFKVPLEGRAKKSSKLKRVA